MKQTKKQKSHIKIKIFTRILVFTIILGIIEDLLAVFFVTKEPITLKIFLIILPISIIFAVIGEIIVNKTHLICSQMATK